MHALTVGVVVNALSGVLMIGLGIFVASVKGGERWNKYFALFAVAFGFAWIIDNLTLESDHLVIGGRVATGMLLVASAFGLTLLALSYPESIRNATRKDWITAITVGVFFVLLSIISYFHVGFSSTSPLEATSRYSRRIGFMAFHAAAWAVLFLMVMRFRKAQGSPDLRSHYTFLSLGFVVYPAYYLGASVIFPLPTAALRFGSAIIVLIVYAALWGWSLHRVPSPGTAKWIAPIAAASALLGMIMTGANNPGFGLSRTMMVVLIAYAIVRHQLLGIDVKVRWTISKTTLAGIFVAVFFVTSEVAQQFFGERLGGPYVGIVAAGLLVFAIAPLSRFADRVAERAIPLSPNPTDVSPEAVYQGAVRMAWSDDELSESDQDSLAALADSLGLSTSRARALQREVEEADHRRSP